MNYLFFSTAYISCFIFDKIYSNTYFRILWLHIWSHIPWCGTVWLFKYNTCYHGLYLSSKYLPSDPSFLGFSLCHGQADPYRLQFPGSHDSWLLSRIGQGELPQNIWGQTKEKVRVLFSLLFCAYSTLWCSSVTLVSFDQVH